MGETAIRLSEKPHPVVLDNLASSDTLAAVPQHHWKFCLLARKWTRPFLHSCWTIDSISCKQTIQPCVGFFVQGFLEINLGNLQTFLIGNFCNTQVPTRYASPFGSPTKRVNYLQLPLHIDHTLGPILFSAVASSFLLGVNHLLPFKWNDEFYLERSRTKSHSRIVCEPLGWRCQDMILQPFLSGHNIQIWLCSDLIVFHPISFCHP